MIASEIARQILLHRDHYGEAPKTWPISPNLVDELADTFIAYPEPITREAARTAILSGKAALCGVPLVVTPETGSSDSGQGFDASPYAA